jgi:hypothetical protein
MRILKLSILLAALLGAAGPASAQMGGCLGACGTVAFVAPTYQGPGDINGTAYFWCGLRAISASYASPGTNPAIDIVDQAGANPLTVAILSTGSLDVASVSAWVTAHSVTTIKVKKCYDQSGSAIHVSQATVANMPSLVLSGVPGQNASRPAMLFDASNSQQLAAVPTTTAVPTPFTVSGVAQPTTTATMYYLGSNTSVGFGFNINAANDVGFFDNVPLVQSSLPINNFYASQYLANGATSGAYINGTGTTGSTGTLNFVNAAQSLQIGRDAFNRFMNGYLDETGAWNGDQSANNAAMNSNQRTYWGF